LLAGIAGDSKGKKQINVNKKIIIKKQIDKKVINIIDLSFFIANHSF